MAFDKNFTGIISKNQRKEKDTHPDQAGSCTIDGVDYWINGWVKENDKGKFLSLSFKPKEAKREEPKRAKQPAYDEDAPF